MVHFHGRGGPGPRPFGLHSARHITEQGAAIRAGVAGAISHAGAHGVLHGHRYMENPPADCRVVGGGVEHQGGRLVSDFDWRAMIRLHPLFGESSMNLIASLFWKTYNVIALDSNRTSSQRFEEQVT